MNTSKLAMYSITYYNSPGIDDREKLHAWIVEVAKIWNRKERAHNCRELDKLCTDEMDEDDGIDIL